MRGALPPVSVGTSSPWSGEMLAAHPQAARQDLSQIKGTYGIHSWHEGESWKDTAGLLSGGSPLKCQPLTHNPKQTGLSPLRPFASLLPRALPLRKIGLAPGFKVLHLLGHLASRQWAVSAPG